MDYKGLRDRHLNVFYDYDGRPELENNITKAFINTIDGLTLEQKKLLFARLFGIFLDGQDFSFEYYLQRKPSLFKVKAIPEVNRIMFCFSPTGEHWGYDGQDRHDEAKVKASIAEIIKRQNPSLEEGMLKDLSNRWFEEYQQGLDRNGSIPDGWIFILKNGIPEYVVCMENKKYNLDPNQINNHMEKSLLKEDKDKAPVYCSYNRINDVMLELGSSWIAEEFLEYMTILGYRQVEDLLTACQSDKEIRRGFVLPFGKEVLTRVYEKGECDSRDHWTWRIKLKGYEYLREINLRVLDEGFCLHLCFGSTMNSGIMMLQKVDSLQIKDKHLVRFGNNFHLLYQRGRNIGNSYPEYFGHPQDKEMSDEARVNEFITYWKKNLNLIKRLSPEEAIQLYERLFEDGMISKEAYQRLQGQLTGKKNKVLVVPEIETKFLWTYEEIVRIGEEELIHEMKEAARKSMKTFGLI